MKRSLIILVFLLVVLLLCSGCLSMPERPVAAVTPAPVEPGPTPDPIPVTEAPPAPATEDTGTPLCDDPAPDFTVTDVNGNSVSLSESYGKPMILNFWATWCPPCRNELPHFNAAYREYGDRINFMMIDLTDGYSETVDGVKDFVAENGYVFPVYFDLAYSAQSAYPSDYIPVTVFIRADGSILDQVVGSMDEATLLSYIGQLLS